MDFIFQEDMTTKPSYMFPARLGPCKAVACPLAAETSQVAASRDGHAGAREALGLDSDSLGINRGMVVRRSDGLEKPKVL
jgi:hypothetical protein